MNNDIAHLSPERHYTAGAASAGRYATDPERRPDMTRLPTGDDVRRREAARPAWLTRYLRQQGVLAWVAQFDEAREEAGRIQQLVMRQEATAETGDDSDGLGRARDLLARAVDRKREASRQLRLLGISPRAQAELSREMARRSRQARAS